MNFMAKNKAKWFQSGRFFCLAMATIALLLSAKPGLAAQGQSVENYKMVSSVEYTGKGQFKNQVESLFTVKKLPLSDGKVQYLISAKDFDLATGSLNADQKSSPSELSFVLDKNTREMSGVDEGLKLWARINNQCVTSLTKVTKENIGKTWQESFDLSFLGGSLPEKLKFDLTAIRLETKVQGEMIGVRALSEPFVISTVKEKGGTGSVQARVSSVYLFDPEIETIYMSISVFEATTDINGYKESLRHEVATYKTGDDGTPVDMSGLGKDFEKLVRKVGLTSRSLKIVKEITPPQWVQFEGLRADQVASTYAAVACEGAVNPVATICIPAAKTAALQSTGSLASIGALGTAGTVSSFLASNVPAVGAMKIAIAPAFLGIGAVPAGAAAAGGAVAIAAGGSSGSSRSNVRSPD